MMRIYLAAIFTAQSQVESRTEKFFARKLFAGDETELWTAPPSLESIKQQRQQKHFTKSVVKDIALLSSAESYSFLLSVRTII
jgi:hypothetical protein